VETPVCSYDTFLDLLTDAVITASNKIDKILALTVCASFLLVILIADITLSILDFYGRF
jgi:hypothetical protein